MCSFVAVSSFSVCNFFTYLCFLANTWRYSCALPPLLPSCLLCPYPRAVLILSLGNPAGCFCWGHQYSFVAGWFPHGTPWHLLVLTVLWGNCCPSTIPCACVFGNECLVQTDSISWWVFFQRLCTTSVSMQKCCYLALGRNQVVTEARRTQNNYLPFQ